MRATVASVLSLALMTGACFPDNARHRTIAKVIEGGVTIGGVTMLYLVNSGADCMTEIPGMPDTACEDRASMLGSIGLGLVLTGLIGFIVTVSTSPEDQPSAPPAATTVAPMPEPTPAEPAAPAAPPAPVEPPPAPAEPVPTPVEPTTP